ncbi:hypothetical protein V6N13_026625 [Hibiscus sabdariffa]
MSGASPIINKIEFKALGMSFGSRRLSLIKKTARLKHRMEISRVSFEKNITIEFGVDPFGSDITSISDLMISNDFLLMNVRMECEANNVEELLEADASIGNHLRT